MQNRVVLQCQNIAYVLNEHDMITTKIEKFRDNNMTLIKGRHQVI